MSSIRALAVELAARSDDALRTLFDARPDLVSPPVPDFAALAARACARASVARALDKLDLPQTQVLEAVHLSTNEDLERTATAATLQPLIEGSSPDVLDGILDQLRALALLYPGGTEGYLPVSSLKDVIGVHPAGLGRSYVDLVRSQTSVGTRLLQSVQALHRSDTGIAPAATPMEAALAMGNWLAQAGSLEQLLKSAPEHTAGILSRFSAGPVGTLPKDRHGVGTGRATSPLDWLLARGLLVALDAEHVELPSDVALVLRGGVVIRGFATTAPVPELQTISEARRSNAALGSIAETLRLLTELLAQVRDHPLATLRAGGVGVREVRRLADSLRIGQERVGLLLELAALSGLLVLDVDTSRWRPADNGWLQLPREEQWARIATSWLRSDRAPSLVGQATVHRPAAGGSGSAAAASRNTGQPAAAQATATINALAAEVHRPDAPVLRQQTLAIMAELAAGAAAPAAGAAEPQPQGQRNHPGRPRAGRRRDPAALCLASSAAGAAASPVAARLPGRGGTAGYNGLGSADAGGGGPGAGRHRAGGGAAARIPAPGVGTRAAAGGPDRHCPRLPVAGIECRAEPAGPAGRPGPGHDLPVQRHLYPPGPGRRTGRRADPGLPGPAQRHRDAPTVALPGGRYGLPARPAAGGWRGQLPAKRRRRHAGRAAGHPLTGAAGTAGAGTNRAGVTGGAPRAGVGAAGTGIGSCTGGRR